MFKTILKWSIYAGVVGLLIFGAVIRTEAKTGETIFQNVRGAGETAVSGNGSGRNGSSSGVGEGILQVENEDHDWIDLEGTVSDLDVESLWVETLEGELLEITGRAWSFSLEAGFQPSIGDLVMLEGFFENGEYEVSAIHNLTSGVIMQVRDETGRPLWAGGSGH